MAQRGKRTKTTNANCVVLRIGGAGGRDIDWVPPSPDPNMDFDRRKIDPSDPMGDNGSQSVCIRPCWLPLVPGQDTPASQPLCKLGMIRGPVDRGGFFDGNLYHSNGLRETFNVRPEFSVDVACGLRECTFKEKVWLRSGQARVVRHGTYSDVNIRICRDRPSFDARVGVQLDCNFIPPVVKAQRDETDSVSEFRLELVEGRFVDVIRHCCDQLVARREIREPCRI